MAMELKFKKCSYEDTLEYYRSNEDFHRYVEMYAKNSNRSQIECLEHDLVQTVAYLYRQNGGNI